MKLFARLCQANPNISFWPQEKDFDFLPGMARILPSHASDPNKAAFSKEDSHFKVLLAHQPNSVFEATKAGFDLQLSGHTHGGHEEEGTQ
jgi:predicted MPP superfamily phosphohydrolase